ncbi:uncharacterized protein LOC111269246 [Varroa jacobsoni]|uniref:uncharacterized protein LOC111269246 n=1 Tax=Varroa jacobsoni TaxID=62625 RepID=UPI000BF60843|nr:uncharacterized protein LOC111269246 [Varroa jacobsoni]
MGKVKPSPIETGGEVPVKNASSTGSSSSYVASSEEIDEEDYTESDSLETTVPSFVSTGEAANEVEPSYELLEHRFVNALPEDEALRELSLRVLYHTWKLDRKTFRRHIGLIDQVYSLLLNKDSSQRQASPVAYDAMPEALCSGRDETATMVESANLQ